MPHSCTSSVSPSAAVVSRRKLLSVGLAASSVSLAFDQSPARAGNPYEEGKAPEYGPKNGRIRACPNSNPNCVSTASTSQLYGPAWRTSEPDASASAKVLEDAVLDVCPGGQLVAAQSLADGEYRAFSVPSLFGQDIVEFLIRQAAPSHRREPGDQNGLLVTYRSSAGSVKYIWPLQAAVSDFGAQRKRLKQIRQNLGWRLVGCEFVECYED
ncbi:hypothetical protein WJX72_001424 [[Myrmecia] bisecta]|uniref:Uncharacterized protein n=1 Tax=[Myrmecia] bisecta TaxID=41462 RepID=A0AAW1NZX4_9CHLO